MQCLSCQLFPSVHLFCGLCFGTQYEAHALHGDSGGIIHYGQPHKTNYAQCCLHRTEKDVHKSLFLATSPTFGEYNYCIFKNGCISKENLTGYYHSPAKDRDSYAHKLSSEFKNHRKYGFITSSHDKSKNTKVLVGALNNDKDTIRDNSSEYEVVYELFRLGSLDFTFDFMTNVNV